MTEGSSRRLFLLRHGRTAWNHAERVQGQTDVDLDETGHAQAARVARVLAGLHPSLLWCSDLARAQQTAAYVSSETSQSVTYDKRLREYGLGIREGLTHAEYAAAAPQEYAEFRGGDFDVVPGGEKTVEVRDRMTDCLSDVLALLGAGQSAVVVSHGAAIRVLTSAVLGLAGGEMASLAGLDNCGWVELRESPTTGRLRVAAYNRVAAA